MSIGSCAYGLAKAPSETRSWPFGRPICSTLAARMMVIVELKSCSNLKFLVADIDGLTTGFCLIN